MMRCVATHLGHQHRQQVDAVVAQEGSRGGTQPAHPVTAQRWAGEEGKGGVGAWLRGGMPTAGSYYKSTGSKCIPSARV